MISLPLSGLACCTPRLLRTNMSSNEVDGGGTGGTPRRVVRVPHSRRAAEDKVPLAEKVSTNHTFYTLINFFSV